MVKGHHNFTDNLGIRYDLEIGSGEPSGDEWPTIKPEMLRYSGHGILALSEDHIIKYDNQFLEKV